MTKAEPQGGNAVHDQRERLAQAWPSARADRRSKGAYEQILRRFLKETNWAGERRRILEVLPYQQPIDSIETLRAILHRLGYETRAFRQHVSALREDSFPCIAVAAGRALLLLARRPDGTVQLYDPSSDEESIVQPGKLRALIVRPSPATPPILGEDKTPWMVTAAGQLRAPIAVVLGLSFAVNIVGLATPVFTAAVYDLVIRARAMETLLYLTLAVALTLLFELWLRRKRGAVIAEVGARFDAALTTAVFQKLMAFPLRMTEGSPVAAQITRLREFEKIRAIFQGNLMNALLDLPFCILFITGIFIFGGALGFIPVALALAYLAMWFFSQGPQQALARRSGAAGNSLQSLMMETVAKRQLIRSLELPAGWSARMAGLARESATARFEAQQLDNALHSAAQGLATAAGAATLGIGAFMVMGGALSMGALIAVMMLIWRVVQPIQTAFLSSQRLIQFAGSVNQFNRLMSMPEERRRARSSAVSRKILGRVQVDGLSFRYGQDAEPALRGVSFEAGRGEIVAVCGHSGAGKSTLLKLVAGLYDPIGGAVFIDGLNLRSLDPSEYRASIGYGAQRATLFHGSLLQNIRLVAPTADEQAIETALAHAALELDGVRFPEGLDTWLRGGGRTLDEDIRTKIMLASIYAKRPKLMLLDDPGAYLDAAGDAALIARLRALRGLVTVLIVTNRPSHLRAADRVIVLERGAVAADGPPEKIVPALEQAGKLGYRNVSPAVR
jgi:ABC-type bacteriocin/lantibiotic exporter with double-glycine peptidase domain